MFRNLTGRKATLLLSSMMTMMAGAVVAPALPLIAQDFSHIAGHELLVRLILTLPALFIAISAPIAGLLCDRIGRKKILIFGLAIYFLAGTAGYYLQGLYPILISRALLGIGVASIMTSVTTLIGDYFRGKERESFMGMQGAFIGIGGITFMSVAGFLAGINWHWPFLIYGFSLPILFMAFSKIQDTEHYGARAINTAGDDTPASPPSPWLIYLIYFTGFIGIVFFFMIPVQVPFLLHDAGISQKYIGMMISLMTLSSAMVSMNYRKVSRILRYPAIIGLAFLAIGVGFLMLSVSASWAMYCISLLTAGLGVGLLMPTSSLWIMHVVPESKRGVFVGRLTTAVFLGQFASPVIIQPLIHSFGVNRTFTIMAALIFVCGITYILIRKKAMPNMPVTSD